jgi:type II secretory pathway pseudopilin PulG
MRARRGSALTEVLVAVFIVTLLVLSIAAISPMSTRMQRRAQQFTFATNVAQTALERIRTLDFLQITANGLISAGLAQTIELNETNRFRVRFTTIQTPGGGTLNLANELRSGFGTIEVVNLTTNNNISIGLKTVIVTVRWQEPRTNQWQQVQLATTIASLK